MGRSRVLGNKGGKRGATVDMAPLIDMVFILLVFFVVTTTFVRESGIEISRPQSSFSQSIENGFLPVAIDKTGTVQVGGRAIAPDASSIIAGFLQETGQNRIVIQADKDVPTSLLLQVLDTCRLSGAEQVDVAAIQP